MNLKELVFASVDNTRNKIIKSLPSSVKGKMTVSVFSAMGSAAITTWYVVTPKIMGLPQPTRAVKRGKHFVRACMVPMLFQNIRLIDPKAYCGYANQVRRRCYHGGKVFAHTALHGGSAVARTAARTAYHGGSAAARTAETAARSAEIAARTAAQTAARTGSAAARTAYHGGSAAARTAYHGGSVAAHGLRYTGNSLMTGILNDLDNTEIYTGSAVVDHYQVDIDEQVEAAAQVEAWHNYYNTRMLRDILLVLMASA